VGGNVSRTITDPHRISRASPYWTVEIVRIVLIPRIVCLLGNATRSRCADSTPGLDSLTVRRVFADGRTLSEGAKGRRGKLYGDR
jgi:hypothetical protein